MYIGCDARALIGPATGVSVWTGKIMAGLAELGGHQIMLAASKALDLPEEFQRLGIGLLPQPLFPWPGTLWLNSALPPALKDVDVFIGSLGVLPRRCPCPAIVMLHDLTPRTHPSHHTVANRFCFNAYLEESLDEAIAVVVGSESTRRVALEHFPWLERKLRIIGYGIDAFFRPPLEGERSAAAARTRKKFSSSRPYILYLGTLEARKNLELLVAAWEELSADQSDLPDLVLAGKEGWGIGTLMRKIETSPLRDKIHLPGYVSRQDALNLMQHTEIFVLPSKAEGFGLPLAEAIACGAPCIASDIPSLRESGGAAARFVAPGDSHTLARTIGDALNPEENARLRARSLSQGAKRWSTPISRWLELLREIG